jgi:HlyD family secretion protein
MLRKTLLGILAVAALGCGSKPKAGEAEKETATPVEVATAERGPIERVVTAQAILYPVSQSAITPKLSAPVRRILVNRGDHVRRGQLLAELEDRDLVAAANENKALYSQAQAQFATTTEAQLPEDMTKARADAQSAKQQLDAAKKVFESRTALVKEGALAQKLADDARVALAQAQSQYDTDARHLEGLQSVGRTAQTRSAQSGVDAAKARFNSAEAQVGYSQIRSPIDGVVADRPVAAGEMASSGSPVITVIDISDIVARANVPVEQIGFLKVGQAATISAPGVELKGKVWVVSPAVDPSSTTLEVWVKARNPGERLKPGTTASVAIEAQQIKDAVIVPSPALLASDEGGSEVMVVGPDSAAHETRVTTGARDGDKVQIVSGLKGGEKVVTVGGVGLADKAKVHVEAGKPDDHE